MQIKKLLSEDVLILDGAMGTYFSQKTGKRAALCEKEIFENEDLIYSIHREYIKYGAKAIRTNTFAANTKSTGLELSDVLKICRKGFEIAQRAAGEDAAVLADIGPIGSEKALDEYKAIIDEFIDCGAENFIFETFPSAKEIILLSKYIKEKSARINIAASFTFSPDGRTRLGHSVKSIINQIENVSEIDVLGFNCGTGPTHMKGILKQFAPFDRDVIVMPNAGYPSVEEQRTIFSATPEFFAYATAEMLDLGIKGVGGCCGTTPEHIKSLSLTVNSSRNDSVMQQEEFITDEKTEIKSTKFIEKINNNKFIVAVELDPPHSGDLSKLIDAANVLKDANVDIITISDSPMARAKMDSIVCSARIHRETGMDVLPHICCRDKNLNALRASLLGAYSESIRSILAVTGDPVPESSRGVVKPVFNVGSLKLMELIDAMNDSDFSLDKFVFGGALNPFVRNKEIEIERVKKKMKCGAKFFLSQPTFNTDCTEFLNEVRALGAKVFVGIMPIVSWKNAWYMHSEVPGISIPENILAQFSPEMTREEAEEISAKISVEIAASVRKCADGFYFIAPFNRAHLIKKILAELKNKNIM